jgi:ABC-2 type transport system ATP-binding protein
MTVVVRARGLTKRFGKRVALAPVDLELRRGEAVAVVGPNGAGKSTLISLLARATKPSGGTVECAEGVTLGWVPQRPSHYGRLSARENLELFARLEGEPDPVGAAARLLERFELPPDGQPSAELSLGNRQRLNVAIALLGRPDALLLDEPTASLDLWQRRRLWEAARALRDGGGAVLFATQNLEELEQVADRVLALRDGEVVYEGDVAGYEDVFAA